MKYLAWLLAFLLFCGQAAAQNGGGPNGGGGGGGGGTPGGSNGQIQYNASGSFGGVGGFTWNGTSLTSPYLSGAGLYSTSQTVSANHVTTAYAAQAGIGTLTGLAATNQSFTALAARNTTAGGYTTISLFNDSYSLGSLLTIPNSSTCCDVNADHELNIYLGGTSAPSGFINGLPAGESAAIATTGINMGLCLGVYAHCILNIEKTYGTVTLADTSGATTPALTVSGSGTTSNTDYAMRVIGPNATGGVSNGLNIQAGADTTDLPFNVQSAAAGLSLFNIRWDGVIKSGVPQALRLIGVAAADMRTGSGGGLSLSGTGFAGDPVGVGGSMTLSGPISCVRLNPFTGTSNASNMTITLPSALPGHGEGTVLVEDNGTNKFGTWYSDGTHIYFAVGAVPADATGNFTATGTKGIPGTVGPALCWPAN